ncbi:hypothetical protein [Aliarcobacter butzleri]|uniref:hypothetical protein n=1 Tax=Aliarcobacter butzleri TaxID=28197 RepID=UPI001269F555|nr:hypothetical protein [Aliarcobacter butzleri]
MTNKDIAQTLFNVLDSDKDNEIIMQSEAGTSFSCKESILKEIEEGTFNPEYYAVANSKGEVIYRCEDAIADFKTDLAEML